MNLTYRGMQKFAGATSALGCTEDQFLKHFEKATRSHICCPRLLTALNSDTFSHLISLWQFRSFFVFPRSTLSPHTFSSSCVSFNAPSDDSTAGKTLLSLSYTVSSAMSERLSSCCPLSINGPFNDHIRQSGAGLLQKTHLFLQWAYTPP